MANVVLLLLLAGFASQGGRATVTYQPTPLDGQGCPSDENKAQVIENIHNLIEYNIETESTPEGRLLTELNTAVETLNQKVTDLSNTTNGTLAELRQEVADLSNTSQIVTTTLTELRQELAGLSNTSQTVLAGLNEEIPATSCRKIFENRPDLPSGYYWIRSSNGTAVRLYCDMARECGCNETTGGWTRIAYLDMTDPNQQCPPNWQEIIASGVRACARPTGTTSGSFHSAFYPSHGTSYSRVCGRVTGYQFCSTSAFGFFLNDDIEHLYVDGLTITHGSPKQHVWTFAAAFIEEDTTWSGCPCINTPNDANPQIPSFIGDDYFCDTGSDVDRLPPCGDISTNLLTDHPLWDGGGCGPTGACCENNNPPWFCTTLPQPTTDDIEVRLTCNEAVDDEDVAIELVEIYIN